VARDFRAVVDAVAAAARRERGVVIMLGGHIVKTGLAPVLVELMARRIVTHVAMNGSAAIHDYEVARFGATSEDVAAGLKDGTFGMAEETGREMNEAFVAGMHAGRGMGETLGIALEDGRRSRNAELSCSSRRGDSASRYRACRARRRDHPSASGGHGAAIGDTSHRDFRRLPRSLTGSTTAASCSTSAAPSSCRRCFSRRSPSRATSATAEAAGFTSVDLDMQRHYRPRMNVVQRPTLHSGKGYEITGHHEIMVPLLVWAVLSEWTAMKYRVLLT
jgi:hypothetical protein